MKKKNIKYLFLAFISTLLMICGVSCKNHATENTGSNNEISILHPVESRKLTVKNSKTDLLIGDEAYLEISCDWKRGDALNFTSSDEAVVAVDSSGKCTAKQMGVSTITVTYGEEQATAQVTVGIGNQIPVLTTDTVKEGKIRISKADEFNFELYIYFNGKKFKPDRLTYTLSDNSIGAIEGNVFKPSKIGTTEICIVAEWADVENAMLMQTFEIEVLSGIELYINDGAKEEFTLYATSSFAGNDYVTENPFVASAYEDEQPLETQVEIVSGEELIEYDEQNKVIRSKGKMGEAEIAVTCYDSQNQKYQKRFKVNVRPSIAKYEGKPIEFETLVGELPLKDIFGKDVELYGAEENGTALEIQDNKIFGVTAVKGEPQTSEICVYTDSCGYFVRVIPYTRIIRTVEDLAEIFKITEIITEENGTRTYIKSATVFDGYYVLGGNIDASGYTHRVTDNTIAAGETETKVAYRDNNRIRSKLNKAGAERPLSPQRGGLTGTFDGRGYTISNLTIEDHGLFGIIYGGTVKNVGFTNVTLKGSTYQENKALFAEQSVDVTFQDVYIAANKIYGGDSLEDVRSDNDARGSRALLAVSAFGKTNVKDCFFTYEIASTTIRYCYSYGLFAYEGSVKNISGSSLSFENVYVITNSALLSSNLAKIYKTTNSSVLLAANDLSATATDEEKESRIYEIVGQPNYDNNMPWHSEGDAYEQYNGRTFLSWLSKQEAGVYRYRSETEMLAAGHDFSHLSNYWVVEEGYLPCFKTTGLEPAKEVSGEFMLDCNVGEFSAEQLTAMFGKSDVTIQSAKFEQTDLTVENNKIQGFPIDRHGEKLSVIIKIQGETLGYKVTVIPVTEYLDSIEDIERIFKITDVTIKADAAGYVESATAFEGYYVLSQDIDASGYTHQVVSGTARDNMKGLTHVGLYAQNGGLKGVFDGNGHTISNLTVGHHGLFGLIYGGTVKNVGFTNVTLKGDTNLENLSFLAEQMIDGTIENVYIQANEIIGGNGTTHNIQSRGNRALLAIVAYGKTTIKNSVFNYNIEGTQKEYARSYGLIAYEHKARWNERYPAGSSVTFENVYVISNAMISSWNTGAIYNKNSSVTIAENEVDVAGLTNDQRKEACQAYVYEKLGGAGNTNITATTITGDRIYRYTGMYRYDTLQDMQAANNDYSGFNTKNWNISDGIIVWKA